MLRHTQELKDQQVLKYDICIVGSGPAAFALALEFTQQQGNDRPQRIVMLESSAERHNQPAVSGVEAQNDFNVQNLYQGEASGDALPYMAAYLFSSRLRQYGGTSNHWGGWCWPYEPYDLEEQPTRPGVQWPITHADLLPYYERAQQTCQLDTFNYDDPQYWIDRLSTADHPLAPMDLAGTPLRTRMVQFNPIAFQQEYRACVDAAPQVDLFRNANVLDLEASQTSDGKQRVSRAVVRAIDNGQPGRTFYFEADYFVVAAGTMETTRLLLLSDLGNGSGQLGRNYIDHPIAWTAAKFTLTDKIPAGVKNFYFPSSQIPVNNGKGTTLMPALVPQLDYIQKEGLANFRVLLGGYDGIPGTINTHWEEMPHPDSYLALSDTAAPDVFGQKPLHFNWTMTDLDKKTVKALLTSTQDTLQTLGYATDFVLPDLTADPRTWTDPGIVVLANHPMGATRMSEKPKDGVVDPNCQVHGVTNLFLATSGTFPSGGYENPTLTIAALSIRLADYLKTAPGH